jgi:hypothetical protein
MANHMITLITSSTTDPDVLLHVVFLQHFVELVFPK